MQAKDSMAGRIAVLLLGAWLGSGAQAQPVAGPIPMRDMLTRYIGMLDTQCPAASADIEAARKGGDENAARLLESFHRMFCTCHRSKARHLLETLPQAQLSKLSETKEQFNEVAVPGIMEPCHGELMRQNFEGDDCLGFISTDVRPGTTAKPYCACMRTEIAAFTDHEITTYLQEITESMPELQAAKAAGKALPQKSKLLTRYVGALDKCGGGQEFLAAP